MFSGLHENSCSPTTVLSYCYRIYNSLRHLVPQWPRSSARRPWCRLFRVQPARLGCRKPGPGDSNAPYQVAGSRSTSLQLVERAATALPAKRYAAGTLTGAESNAVFADGEQSCAPRFQHPFFTLSQSGLLVEGITSSLQESSHAAEDLLPPIGFLKGAIENIAPVCFMGKQAESRLSSTPRPACSKIWSAWELAQIFTMADSGVTVDCSFCGHRVTSDAAIGGCRSHACGAGMIQCPCRLCVNESLSGQLYDERAFRMKAFLDEFMGRMYVKPVHAALAPPRIPPNSDLGFDMAFERMFSKFDEGCAPYAACQTHACRPGQCLGLFRTDSMMFELEL